MTFSPLAVAATIISITLGVLGLLTYLVKVVSVLKEMQSNTKINHANATAQRDLLDAKVTHAEQIHAMRFSALELELANLKKTNEEIKGKFSSWDGKIERLHDRGRE